MRGEYSSSTVDEALPSGVTRVDDTGAATEGVTPLFFPEKPGDLFCSSLCHYHYRFLLLLLVCHPLQGVTPHLLYLSDLVSPLFFVNLPAKILFLRVSPPGGCHPGRSAPRTPLVTPLALPDVTYRSTYVPRMALCLTENLSVPQHAHPTYRSDFTDSVLVAGGVPFSGCMCVRA